jgi:hypothetical protein
LTDNYQAIHFFDHPIEVIFDTPPAREKSPDCPNGFIWEEKTYRVIEMLSSWSDFTRRGKMARNMRPAHAAVASSRGSLNVGRFYFRVRVRAARFATLAPALHARRSAGEQIELPDNTGSSIASPSGTAGHPKSQVFDIYYDRAMKNIDERKGQWFLYREMEEK